ncbi:MAG TPA: hypothetical protein VH480_08775 [Streptosporangiaceae bacterium]|jgi:hypothetical protein
MLVELAVIFLWFIGGAAVIMAAIMILVGSRLRRRSQAAGEWPNRSCAEVTAESGPLHLNGVSAPGPQGMLQARLSATECIWYRNRVMRNFWVTRWTADGEGGSVPVTEPMQEQVWEWESGPFSLADSSGGVLIDPALLRRTANLLGYPMQQVIGETLDDGPEAWHYRGGMMGALQADGLMPADLLDALAEPEARTFGYRVIEEVLHRDMSLHVFAVPSTRDGRVIMRSPFRDLPAISAAEPVPDGQARGARKATRWAAVIGGAGLACFGLSALLLPMLPG